MPKVLHCFSYALLKAVSPPTFPKALVIILMQMFLVTLDLCSQQDIITNHTLIFP